MNDQNAGLNETDETRSEEPTPAPAGEEMHANVVVNPAHPVDEDPEELAGDVVPDPWSDKGSWEKKGDD